MTDSATHQIERITALPETLSLAYLSGLRRLRPEHVEYVHGGQLRASDRMLSLCSVLAGICVILVSVRFNNHVSPLLLVGWACSMVAALIPLLRIRKFNAGLDYAAATRGMLLWHGALSFLQAAIWVAAMIAFTPDAKPQEVITLWTIACCLMAAVAISFQSTPLSAVSFITTIGTGATWMMLKYVDPMLASVVATYSLLVLGACLWQAHLFGVQLTTSKMLAEKREVVSLLLKEHDVDSADVLWQTDVARRFTNVSALLARMLGMPAAEIEHRSILQVLAGPAWEGGQFDPALHSLAEKLKAKAAFSDLILPVIVKGAQRWWSISASPRMDDKGTFLGFRGVCSDITQQKESSERINQLARYDMLTGLPNRLHLTEELALAVQEVGNWHSKCSFLMIDLDRFKSVNDTLGHQTGDQLLAQVAQRIRKVCSGSEVCGRIGGDEFAVVVRDVSDHAAIDRLADAIIDEVSKPYVVDSQTLFIGASIGSSIAPQDGSDAETLMRSADLAMYRAKEDGRGKHFRFALSMHADAEERRTIELALRDALAKDQLHLMFQPIVAVRSGEVVGFEALVRWTHPEMGIIPPSRFIPVAEDARLIAPIGNWVLHSACIVARDWPDNVHISVNVSAEQLYDAGFFETVVSALAQGNLSPERLELEVTESVFLREGRGAGQLLEKLTQLGIRLSLDDFGTGYSSLGYLSRTKFNTIKIDRSFVAGAARSQRESLAIIHAVVAMAQSLGMETTAEGVESETEYEVIRALGCTKIQGYYFGRPMQADDALALFDSSASQVA